MVVAAVQVMLGWAEEESKGRQFASEMIGTIEEVPPLTTLGRLLPQELEMHLVVSYFLVMSQCPLRTRLSLAGRLLSSRATHLECLGPRGIVSLDLIDLHFPNRLLPLVTVQALLRLVSCYLPPHSPASAPRPQIMKVDRWWLFVARRVLMVLT